MITCNCDTLCHLYEVDWQGSPIRLTRQPYPVDKAALSGWQGSPIRLARQTYPVDKADLSGWQGSPIQLTRQPYPVDKAALSGCQNKLFLVAHFFAMSTTYEVPTDWQDSLCNPPISWHSLFIFEYNLRSPTDAPTDWTPFAAFNSGRTPFAAFNSGRTPFAAFNSLSIVYLSMNMTFLVGCYGCPHWLVGHPLQLLILLTQSI